jgi:two-component system cell cycle sensor histidine kinase/response regulator CckA
MAETGKKILVVEDEELLRESLELILQSLGHEVILAEDGLTAFDIIREQKNDISLIISDFNMPNMNGGELLDLLQVEYPTMKVLFMSGHTREDLQEKGLMKSDFTLIGKPFNKAGLEKAVRQMLAK